MVQESFKQKYSSKSQSVVFAAVRISLVLLIALVAAGVPGFGLFIALIGSLACASLSFIVPALCHLILFQSDLNWYVLLGHTRTLAPACPPPPPPRLGPYMAPF